MTAIKVVHGPEGRDTRSVKRAHIWKQPSEGVVAGIIGGDQLDNILQASADLRMPVQISGLPQAYAYRGGLVTPRFGGGYAFRRSYKEIIREQQKAQRAHERWEAELAERQAYGERIIAGATGGFTDLGDILAKGSKVANNEVRAFSKTGGTGVVGVGSSLWRLGALPAAGAVGAALATGTNCTRSTTGALAQADPTSGYTKHLVSAFAQASVQGNTLLLFDRIWHGAPAMASTGAQTVTMTAARYATTGASGLSRGNAIIMEVGTTALAATAHNNTYTYVDDMGNTAEAAAAFAGRSGAIADTHDQPVNGAMFAPLNAGDVGVSDITQYQCSASVATGVMNLVLLHPLLFVPCGAAYFGALIDGINSDISLEEVLTDACLSLAELAKPATTATTYHGHIRMIQGNAA